MTNHVSDEKCIEILGSGVSQNENVVNRGRQKIAVCSNYARLQCYSVVVTAI